MQVWGLSAILAFLCVFLFLSGWVVLSSDVQVVPPVFSQNQNVPLDPQDIILFN